MSKKIYQSAHGKLVDIDAIRVANEETIAVGNMKVNARGDKLAAGGKISETRNQVQDAYNKITGQEVTYSVTPGVKMSSGVPRSANRAAAPQTVVTKQEPAVQEQTDTTSDDAPTAQMPAMRSSLAASIAAPATVKQEQIPDPRKAKGPSRI